MASAAATSPAPRTASNLLQSEVDSFHEAIKNSKHVLALLGAGLSASSGLPTFRGAGGLWRSHEATELATPEAFQADPGLVWQFYSYRRHMALKAKPNAAHYALAELAKKMPGFQSLTQNVDGLSSRAGHPRQSLHLLHGSLFDVKCTGFYCKYVDVDNFKDPIVPALALPTDESDPTTNAARGARAQPNREEQAKVAKELDISDENVALPEIPYAALPKCPSCKRAMMRPGVVWFGEALPHGTLDHIQKFIRKAPKIDIILVIGTSAKVYPAAGYVDEARHKGARVAVINTEGDLPASGLRKGDWLFQGDAAAILPEILRPVIGDVQVPEEKL